MKRGKKTSPTSTAIAGALSLVLFPAAGAAANEAGDTPDATPQTGSAAPKTQAGQAAPIEAVTPTPAAPDAAPEIAILFPPPETVLDLPSTEVVVQFPVGHQAQLSVNGKNVDPTQIGRTETDPASNLVTQFWYGVSLDEGSNTLTAEVSAEGNVGSLIECKVAVRGAPKRLTLRPAQKRAPADGRSRVVLVGELLDAAGNRSNRDAVVTLITSAGSFDEEDYSEDAPGFQVLATQGRFTATLRTGLQAQTVVLGATTGDLQSYTQIEFETALLPGLVAGVFQIRLGSQEGDLYRSFRDFLAPGNDTKLPLRVYSAAFATGQLGNWQLTGAYNSERRLNPDPQGRVALGDVAEADQVYPLYGDNASSTRLAQSRDRVFLRLERNRDYALWGDYGTQEFATRAQEFSATTRQLHALKGNYHVGNLQFTGFYGDNVQGFARDTLAPDGTSGYYFLSQRLLIVGSENVTLELEDLERPGVIVARKSLLRGADYEVDYDRGTLLFRQPLLRTDTGPFGEVLTRKIVVTYQYDGQDRSASALGSRLRYHFGSDVARERSIGTSYVRENQGTRRFELKGIDALLSLNNNGHLLAEYARSTNGEAGVRVDGSAFRVEAEREVFRGVQARVFGRSAGAGFANNATTSFVPGQTRLGTSWTARVGSATHLRLQYEREKNFGIAPQALTSLVTPGATAAPGTRLDNRLTSFSIGAEQRLGSTSLQTDWIARKREDRAGALAASSQQLLSRVSVPLASSLTFRALNTTTLSAQVDTVVSDRTSLGVDWAVRPGVEVRLAQELFHRGPLQGKSVTRLDTTSDYALNQNTQVLSRFSLLKGADGLSGQGTTGLKHGLLVARGLRLNLTYERVLGDFFNRSAAGPRQGELATGQSGAALGFAGGQNWGAGLEYTGRENLQASARYERQLSSGGGNTALSASISGKLSTPITALLHYQQAGATNRALGALGDTGHLKVGLAYRHPRHDRWNALLRYEYRRNPSTIPTTLLLGSGTGARDHTFAVEGIYAPSWRWEHYGKYAVRNSTSYLAQDFTSHSRIGLAQWRSTYRLGFSAELVGEARWVSQPSAGYQNRGFAVEAGFYLTPDLRLGAGYSFGKVDDVDFSGSRYRGGVYVGVTAKLNELFSGWGLQKRGNSKKQNR